MTLKDGTSSLVGIGFVTRFRVLLQDLFPRRRIGHTLVEEDHTK